jgi:GPH family glycoside/pentoside/hexuronide:cation symporter
VAGITWELPRRTRLLYASASLGGEALSQSRGAWLVFYYNEEAGLLSLPVVGALLTAGRLVEAFDDALIGWWSDRTQSRLGRRIPFVLGATPPWALFAVLVFSPPASGGTPAAAWLLVTIELMFLFSTLSGGPYEALLPEIARTSAERVRISGAKVYFGAAGGLVGLALGGLIVDHFGFQAMAVTMAGILLVSRYVGLAGVWRLAKASRTPARLPFREALRATFSNVHFLRFLPSFVFFQVGLQMLLGVLPFFVQEILGREEEGTWVAILTAVAIGVTLATVPVLARLARRSSKRQVFGRSMLLASLVFPLLAVAGFVPGIPKEAQIVAYMALAGLPIAGVYLFPGALTADIVDDDAARMGMRREATYYGTQNVVEKTASSLSPLLMALVLMLGDTQDDPLGIRLAGPVAGLIVLAGWLVFRRYELPDQNPPPEAGAR